MLSKVEKIEKDGNFLYNPIVSLIILFCTSNAINAKLFFIHSVIFLMVFYSCAFLPKPITDMIVLSALLFLSQFYS